MMRSNARTKIRERQFRKQCRFLWVPKRIGRTTKWLTAALWEEELWRDLETGAVFWKPVRWVEPVG